MSLTILGSLAFDDITTPFGKSGKIVGGAAIYSALSASNFSKDVSIVSVVGNDFPESELEFLKEKNISCEGIKIIKDQKSFYWRGVYRLDMNTRDTIDTHLNVLASFDPHLPNVYQTNRFLFLGNLDPKVQLKVLNQFDKRPQFVGLDTMNFWIDNCLEDLKKIISRCDLLFLNDSEARQLGDNYSLLKASDKILKMGPKYLIIKKGENGSLLFYGDNVFSIPALPLSEVCDPTGAGDTFAGGVMGYLLQFPEIDPEYIKSSMVVGSAMASFCVEKFGTLRLREINQNDILKRIENLVDLVKFDIKLM